MLNTDRKILLGFIYARQCMIGLSKSNVGCWDAMNYQLSLIQEEPVTDEEKHLLESLENDVWYLLKAEGYTNKDQRDARKRIAKTLGGKLDHGKIRLK